MTTPTPESQRERARGLLELLDKAARYETGVCAGFMLTREELLDTALQSAFTAGREAGLREAEAALLAHANDADFCANSQISWYEAQGPEAYAAAARKCADVIARLRSEGGGK